MYKQQKLYVIRIKDSKGRKKNILRLLYGEEEAYSFGYTEVLSVAPLFADNIEGSTAETIMKEEEK